MNSTDLLIRRIGAVLNGEAEGFEARALASDYAALIESTRDRLHQCATLIRTHNEHTALQIAESEPPVLDLAAKLAFADSAKWRAWCKAAGLPSPAPLEDHLIELVNSLYSKAIDQTHPLYKEYRAAVRERDDLRALTVLRSITRVNTGDANAREEYDRLAAKVRRELLAQVRDAFIHRRHEEAFGAMTRLESTGLGPFDDNADWRDATKAREDWQRRKMQGEVLMIIPDLLRLKAAGEWEACIPLLAKAATLRRQYGLHIGAEDEKQFAHLESWVMGHSAVAEKVRQERELIDNLLSGVEALFQRCAKPPVNDAEAVARIADIDAWIAYAKASPDTVHLETALHRAADIREETVRRRAGFKRSKRTTLVAATFGTLVVVVIAALLIAETWRARSFADALAAAESENKIHPVEAFLAGPVKSHPEYATRAEYAPRIAALKTRMESASRTLSELLHGARGIVLALSRPQADVADLTRRLAELESRYAALPEDRREEARAELARAGEALAAVSAAAATRATAALDSAEAELKSLLLHPDLQVSLEKWPEAVQRLKTALAAPEAAGASSAESAKATLARALTVFPAAAAKVRLHRALDGAPTLDAHLAAIAEAASAEGDSAAITAARLVHTAAADLRRLPLSILPAATAALVPHATPGTRFIGGETGALEASDAARFVAECARGADLWRLPIAHTAADGTGGNLTAYFKGRPEIVRYDLNGGEEIRTKGERIKPDGTAAAVNYVYRRFDGRPGAGDLPGTAVKAPESELFAIGAKLFDSDRSVFTESPIQLADRIYAAKSASPILRARLLLLLRSMMESGPEARGLAFVPELNDELVALRKICNGATPPENAWISPERYGDILPGLVRHFEVKRPAYAAYADFRVRLLRATLDAGCAYAGACDETGVPVLLSPAPARGARLIALDPAGKPAVVGVVGESGAIASPRAAAAYSPVFVLAKSPAGIAATIQTPVRPEPPAGDWTNLVLPAP